MPDDVFVAKSTAIPNLVETGRGAATHALAASVLVEMRDQGILPTPRNYDLWFTYRTDMNPALTDRMRLVLDEGQPLTPAVFDTLYDGREKAKCRTPSQAAYEPNNVNLMS